MKSARWFYGWMVGLGVTAGGMAWAVSEGGFTPPENRPVLNYQQSPLEQQRVAAGVVEAKDSVKEMIQIRDEAGRSYSFYINTTTPIYGSDGLQIPLTKINPGDLVAIKFVESTDAVRQVQKLNQNISASPSTR